MCGALRSMASLEDATKEFASRRKRDSWMDRTYLEGMSNRISYQLNRKRTDEAAIMSMAAAR